MSASDIFYARPEDITDSDIRLSGGEYHHLKNVHRKQIGDHITVVNGDGLAWIGEIRQLSDDNAKVHILESLPEYGEPKCRLSLAVAVPKRDKFEWILEKGTELGVTRFIPLLTERTIVKPGAGKHQRWQKIIVAAIKQCQRSRLPEISAPQTFQQLLDRCPDSTKLIAHEKATDSDQLSQAHLENQESVIVCVGPEGGFTEVEIAAAQRNGFQTVSLGPRRLRTETAAISATAIIAALTQF